MNRNRLSIPAAAGLIFILAPGIGRAAEIPFPAALNAAHVEESRISDIEREGLVVGNGGMAGLLWERRGTLCIRVTKNDIWDARVDTSQDPPMMRVNVANNTWSGGGDPPSYGMPYPQPRCAAVIRIGGKAGPGIKYALLDLRRAVAKAGGATIRALSDRNVFLIETGEEVFLEEIKAPELPAAELGETGGVKWLRLKMPGDLDYGGMEYALAVARAGVRSTVSVVTSRETRGNVRDEAIRLARQAAAERPASLVLRHEAQWAEYWSASGVDLPDSDFQPWWYRMSYFLRCFSKPGVQAIGLWGVLPDDKPQWHGDYHHNYNAWQPFWSSNVLNHPELADPWVRYMNEMLPRMKWLAQATYDCEGAFIGIVSFPFEPDPSVSQSVNRRQIAVPPYGYTVGMTGMSAQVLWYSHLYRPDRSYLEEQIYPVVREVALFYASFAEKCPRNADGKVRFGPSFSPEHGRFGVADVPFDLAYARFTLDAAISAARELGRDDALITRFGRALDLLPGYPTAPDDEGRPVVVDWTGCKFREIPEHNITVPAVPVFPADQVTWFSPEPVKELFRNTMLRTLHRGCNSTVMFSVAKARLSMLDALDDALRYYKPLALPNGMFYWPMHGYYLAESIGIAAMISEYLLQSVDGTLRLFPCWPKEKDAKFAGLRAQGGFLVTAEQAGGHITKLEITSTVGGGLRLVSPWPRVQVDGKLVPIDSKGIVELDTLPGQRCIFFPPAD